MKKTSNRKTKCRGGTRARTVKLGEGKKSRAKQPDFCPSKSGTRHPLRPEQVWPSKHDKSLTNYGPRKGKPRVDQSSRWAWSPCCFQTSRERAKGIQRGSTGD